LAHSADQEQEQMKSAHFTEKGAARFA
jgi:hypothetical protein